MSESLTEEEIETAPDWEIAMLSDRERKKSLKAKLLPPYDPEKPLSFAKDLGQNIQRERKYRRFSQEDLADMVGVSRATISSLETGQTGVSLDTFIKCLMSLDAEIDINWWSSK